MRKTKGEETKRSFTGGAQAPDVVSRHHTHFVGPNQCCSAVVQQIVVPVSTVWSVVRRFDNPQAYKHFVKSCHVVVGDNDVGTLREVHVISSLPVANRTKVLQVVPPRLVLRLQRSVVQVRCTKEDGQSEQPPLITTNPQQPPSLSQSPQPIPPPPPSPTPKVSNKRGDVFAFNRPTSERIMEWVVSANNTWNEFGWDNLLHGIHGHLWWAILKTHVPLSSSIFMHAVRNMRLI
ncbi:Abscisic acid receptor PYL4 [Vitis vinifera]|uniref:Abscisic acid receptor PYL4 n=1 Tax=Vitis vinifera TaxID=29760 RepID=A0A438D1Q3_VITVI|nr:Abscisic acid receptor PYL4 [Vitis vinifera]